MLDLLKIVFVVTILIVFAMVLAFIFWSMDENTMSIESERYTVADPDVNKVCTLSYMPYGDVFTVRYYNGTAWKTLGVGDYTLAGQVVTINAAAMD